MAAGNGTGGAAGASEPHVTYTVSGGLATVTLNRPQALNAFTDQMESGLLDCFDRADGDPAVKVVILTGAGGAFCAGMDLAETPDPRDAFVAWRRRASEADPRVRADVDLPVRRDGGGRVALRMFSCRKPIIAAINGHAAGVGVTMTLPADLRIASEDAKFAFPFTRRGFVPESCSSWFLPRVVPPQQALEWLLTGRTFTAQEALEGGLVRSLHPAGDVYTEAVRLACEIADNTSAVSAGLSRQMLWRMMTAAHPMDAHRIETHALNIRGVSADAREGIAAFFEKRQAAFTDTVPADFPDVFAGMREPVYERHEE